MERTPFLEAIEDENLLGKFFNEMSFPAQVTLKALYGLELSGSRVNPETGWNELDYWAIVQGSCEYDDLGYVTKIIPLPYHPKEYDQLWAIIGRRAGKTSQLQSFIIAYEATLGGHEEYIQQGQECIIYLIAQKLGVASANMQFVRGILDSSPILSQEIDNQISELIRLKNGISIVPSPPSLKSQRGLACPVVAMDEVGFWYKDADSANPDFEVERAVTWSQLQFPNFKRMGISTPWTKEGLLWKYYKAGTDGIKLAKELREEYQNILVCFGTSASFESPLIRRDRLAKELIADKEGFERESLCVFPDSISGFLSRELLEIAAAKGHGTVERAPVNREKIKEKGGILPNYIAAMDPAFRQDSFAFTIVHREGEKGVVVDVLRQWTPSQGQRLNPKEILIEINDIIKPYDVSILYTDQYQLESLQQLALEMGLYIEGVDFTAGSKSKIFGSLQQLVNQKKLDLLDPNLSEAAKNTFQELVQLERRLTSMGRVQISAPEGKHDDMATVIALACFKAVWMEPTVVIKESPKEPTLFERGMKTIQKNNQLLSEQYF